MSLRVVVLHFKDGIGALGGSMSISAGAVEGGPRAAKSIRRVPGGYLVDWDGRGGKPGKYVVHDAQIACAEVAEEVEPEWAEEQLTPAPAAPVSQVVAPARSAKRPKAGDKARTALAGATAAAPASSPGRPRPTPIKEIRDGVWEMSDGTFMRLNPTPPTAAELEAATAPTAPGNDGLREGAKPFSPGGRRRGPHAEPEN